MPRKGRVIRPKLWVIESLAGRLPWENGYCESFNGKLRDECLKPEIFHSLKEAQVVIGLWRDHNNRVRLHLALGYRPPAPVTIPDVARRLPTVATMQKLPNRPGLKYRSGQHDDRVDAK